MRARKVFPWIGVLMAAAISPAAYAQGIATLVVGQSKTGSATNGVDFYRLGGTTGTELKLTLTGPGSSGLILYTPDGKEIVSAHGKDIVRLHAILSLDDAFLVGVVRTHTAPYSIQVAGLEPDGHFANFASGVGYAHKYPSGLTVYQCWIDPGRQLRLSASDGEIQIATIGRGGMTYFSRTKDGQSEAWENVRTVEANEEVYTTTVASGRTQTRRRSLDADRLRPNLGFVSYLCD